MASLTKHELIRILQELTESYKSTYHFQMNREINQGLCVDFAEDILDISTRRFGDAIDSLEVVSEDYLKCVDDKTDEEVWDIVALREEYHSHVPDGLTTQQLNANDTGYHVWLEFQGLFFDSECHEGVKNLFDLPFYQRFTKRIRANMEYTTMIK